MDVSDLKRRSVITRADIALLLESIGKPGEKRVEKLDALKELNRSNRQGHDLSLIAESFAGF